MTNLRYYQKIARYAHLEYDLVRLYIQRRKNGAISLKSGFICLLERG